VPPAPEGWPAVQWMHLCEGQGQRSHGNTSITQS
jgi:hypothetical protein